MISTERLLGYPHCQDTFAVQPPLPNELSEADEVADYDGGYSPHLKTRPHQITIAESTS